MCRGPKSRINRVYCWYWRLRRKKYQQSNGKWWQTDKAFPYFFNLFSFESLLRAPGISGFVSLSSFRDHWSALVSGVLPLPFLYYPQDGWVHQSFSLPPVSLRLLLSHISPLRFFLICFLFVFSSVMDSSPQLRSIDWLREETGWVRNKRREFLWTKSTIISRFISIFRFFT